MTSAYPVTLDKLTEQVKTMAIELGKTPSRNRIMRECKVGADKAKAVLAALEADRFEPTQPDTSKTEDAPTRHLHSVTPADQETAPVDAGDTVTAIVADVEATPVVDPVPAAIVEPVPVAPEAVSVTTVAPVKRVRSWPLLLLAVGAFVAIWGGWVGLGEKAGFGPIRLLPGIADDWVINSAITLPIGVEAYAAYALRVWLAARITSLRARQFAKWSAIGSLVLGAAGQVAYHLMEAAGVDVAPWWITTFVSVLPVVVLGCGAALTHLLHADHDEEARQ